MPSSPALVAPTGTPPLKDLEPTPTDAEWSWGQGFQAAVDLVFHTQGTPLLLSQVHHGHLARRTRMNALANVTMVIVVGEGMFGSTTVVAEEAFGGGRLENDWTVVVPRLLWHHLPERRWLWQRTSTTIGEFVPSVGSGVGQPQGQTAQAPEAPASSRGGVGAGRELHPGLRAVDDLRRWLTLSIADVARISGLSESTIYWWAEHPTSIPRPAKIDRLLGLQVLVGGLIDDLGQTITDRWFRSGQPSRLERLRSDSRAMAAIEEEGYDLLMHRARRRLVASGPGRPVTDDDDRRDLARLAEQERDFHEPLTVEVFDPNRLESDDLP